jgi:archaellum component FlaC
MASITLKDYLISLSTKGSISDSDLLPLLDSGADNALKKITKGALVNLSDIDGFTEFSSSIEGDLFALSFASGATVETSLQQQIDINNLGAYTQSLKSAIIVDGTDVQIIGELRADKFYVNYITSSVSLLTGSNEFGDTLADRHTFIGDVYINGDGPIGLLQLNTQTGSQNTLNTSLGLVTSSLYGEVSSFNLVFGGVSAVTGAFATELGQLQNNVTDFTNVLSGVAAVSGAIVAELAGIQNNITSFNNVFSGVSAVTGAFATELGQLQTQNTSQGGVNSGISAVTGAFATELGQLQTQNTSQNGVNSGTSAVTGAFTTELGGIQNNITSFNNVFGGVSAVTGAFATELGGIQTTLGGHRNELSGIEAYTASLKGAIEISGQDVNVLGMITAQQFNVTLVSSSVMYQSGSTEFGDTVDDVHTFTGTINLNGLALGTSELMAETASQDSVNTGISAVTGAFATELGSIDTHILGVSTQTGSQDGVNLGISTFTGSLRDEVDGIEAYTASLKGAAIVSSSQQIENYNLFAVTSSANTFYGNQTIGGDLLPETTEIHDLGSPSLRWRDLYLSGSTIDLGGLLIQRGADGNVQFIDSASQATKSVNIDSITGSLDIDGSLTVNDITASSGIVSIVNNGGSQLNITTNNQAGSSGTPLQTNINFLGYNGNQNGRIRVDDISGTAQIGAMEFYTWNSAEVLALRLAHTGAATVSNGLTLTAGNLAVASGYGIDFSATSDSAGMTSELLDDYEEGTWTPEVIGSTGTPSGVTYNHQGGSYTKIGNTVWIRMGVNIANVGTGGSGTLQVTGLPFTPRSEGGYQEPTSMAMGGRWVTAGNAGFAYAFVKNSEAKLEFRTMASNADTALTYSELQGGAAGTGTWFTLVTFYHV